LAGCTFRWLLLHDWRWLPLDGQLLNAGDLLEISQRMTEIGFQAARLFIQVSIRCPDP